MVSNLQVNFLEGTGHRLFIRKDIFFTSLPLKTDFPMISHFSFENDNPENGDHRDLLGQRFWRDRNTRLKACRGLRHQRGRPRDHVVAVAVRQKRGCRINGK